MALDGCRARNIIQILGLVGFNGLFLVRNILSSIRDLSARFAST